MEIEQVRTALEQKAGFISTLSGDVAHEVQKYINEAMKILEVCISEKNKKVNQMSEKLSALESRLPSTPDNSGELFELIGPGLRRLDTGATVKCIRNNRLNCNNQCVGFQSVDTGDIRICTGQEISIKRAKKSGRKPVKKGN